MFTCFIDFRKDFDFHWPNGLFKEQHLRTLQTLNVTLKLNSKGGIFHYRKARRTFTKKKKNKTKQIQEKRVIENTAKKSFA